ncbi:hypothetical protein HELRODRAFT_83454 [Helobdella robusta]|uniref:Succinate dehydrogenase assembly factor 3 n=1 Tax=Helobdella robusta TaxID=6412 RepID=T1G557_HELRO|nr:hypothetical protein HELRODRAFT_83454 [Helobdella robusta]ESO00002.1 hypothetical protein HELRODRAFT_83454 [Helobdella robusta]
MASRASKARILYKTILRLHRGLPAELKEFGDRYVRDEFKRHKTAESQFVPTFFKEWTRYANTLSKQIGKSAANEKLGLGFSEEELNKLNEEQVGQLFELYQETQRVQGKDVPEISTIKSQLKEETNNNNKIK